MRRPASVVGSIDASFTTEQRDLFASGIVAEIGVNAYAVWSAIKFFADYNTGHAWPGMRTLGDKLGLSAMTVKRAIDVLAKNHMLRIIAGSGKRRGQTYVARERLCIRFGESVIATIVVDYIPSSLRGKLNRLEQALQTGENDPEAFAMVEVIPGPGLEWDNATKTLKGAIPAHDVPRPPADDYHTKLGAALLSRLAPKK